MKTVVDASALRSEENRYRRVELEDRYRNQVLNMASMLVSLIDLRDAYTGGHSTRVAQYAYLIATEMGLKDSDIETIVMAASLHDVGKIGVPDNVLLKVGRLTDEEFECMKKHAEFGWMVLRNVDGFEEASLMLLHHHERFGGGGYPGELSGAQIPLGARVIAVADTYDALTTNRPYRSARTHEEAVREIHRCTGTQFDPDCVRAFLAVADSQITRVEEAAVSI